MNSRMRARISVALIVISGLLLPLGLAATWANATIYDSITFSERSVDLLNSPSVRKEVAPRITEQLARSGNQQAVNFRPAFQLAVEAAIDTDTFRSIFRTAIKRTHQAILVDQSQGTSGLDLSDSFAIIASTLQLPDNAAPGQKTGSPLGTTFADTTERLGSYGIWRLDEISSSIALLALAGSLALGIAAVAVATDRRQAVKRLGWAVIAGGVAIMFVLQIGQFVIGRFIDDGGLRPAVEAALARSTADLFMIGLWTAGYGVVIAAATAAMVADARRVTPAGAAQAVAAWTERRRLTRSGTLVLAGVAFLTGILLISSPGFWMRAAVVLVGLWLVYFAVTEVLRLVRSVTVENQAAPEATSPGAPVRDERRCRRDGLVQRRGLVVRSPAQRRRAAGQPQLHVIVALPGLALRRADLHHPRPTRRRDPGAAHRHPLRHPVGLEAAGVGDTDRAHRPCGRTGATPRRGHRPGHRGAGRPTVSPGPRRHRRRRAGGQGLDPSGGRAGLLHARDDRSGSHRARVRRAGGDGAPDWHHKAYEYWFQETGFKFTSVGQFDYEPNRGPSGAPFFLMSHWITSSPPDPSKASQANTRAVLEDRIGRCITERGQYPNAVAPDEIVARTDLAAARADAALAVLRALGVSDEGLDQLADLAVEQVADPQTDAIEDQDALIARLVGLIGGQDRVITAAAAFAAANPEPPGLFDFGDVAAEVARPSGYACLLSAS